MSEQEAVLRIADVAETDRLGAILAKSLPKGSVIALIGTLGAGKTRLVQSVGAALGAEPGVVSSPTFVLIHEYDTEPPIYHFDAYRLSSEDEFRRLGPDDYFEGQGLSFVEWADKFPGVLPGDHLEVRIEIVDERERVVHISSTGQRFRETVDQIERRYLRAATSGR